MLRKIIAVYSLVIGISIIGLWVMLMLTGEITEGKFEISFHITSEFIMAITLLIAGYGLLKGKIFARSVFLISNGMLIYSVLNAAGYYGESKDFIMMFMFLLILLISILSLLIIYRSK